MKKIAPGALNVLKTALAHIYWYKRDLRSFLINCLSDAEMVPQLDWDAYKVAIVDELVDRLARNESLYQPDLLRLMSEVGRFDDFSHLEHLDDGPRKVAKAKLAVAALRKHMATHLELVEEQREVTERREKAREERQRNKATQERLEELRSEYLAMIGWPAQKRGYALESLMNELFDLFDLDPKVSFRIEGEQIDGAFSFEGTDYLFEARWGKDQTPRRELDIFDAKIARKLENTLGLFLSINGFRDEGVSVYTGQRHPMILMDGADLMAVLDGRIELDRLLLLKRRRAAQKGQIYAPIMNLLEHV